jgi:TRAP-type transport system small permease protein
MNSTIQIQSQHKGDEILNRLLNSFSKGINIAMATALAIMAILVFGNVLLRYIFNTGITWSEEVSRYLFVWLTFIGAIGALKDNQHLGVDMLVKKLSPGARKIAFLISNVIVLYVLWLALEGSWKITLLNTKALSPALGIPMSYVYASGIVMAIGMAIIILHKMYQVFFKKVPIEELEKTVESEEEIMSSSKAANVTSSVLKAGER